MRFAIVVTGPAYGTQQASSAFQFAQALIAEGHELSSVFFYMQHGVALNICVAAALRRGVVDETEAGRLGLASSNLQPGFTLSGLGALAEASLTCDRVVQF